MVLICARTYGGLARVSLVVVAAVKTYAQFLGSALRYPALLAQIMDVQHIDIYEYLRQVMAIGSAADRDDLSEVVQWLHGTALLSFVAFSFL